MPQNDPRKARRWYELVDGGMAPDAATAQVEREFASPAGPPKPVRPSGSLGLRAGFLTAQEVAGAEREALAAPQRTTTLNATPEEIRSARRRPYVLRGLRDLGALMGDAPVRANAARERAVEEAFAQRPGVEGKFARFVQGSIPFLPAIAASEAVLPSVAARGVLGVAARMLRPAATFGLAGGGITAGEGGAASEVAKSAVLNAALGAGFGFGGEAIGAVRRLARRRALPDIAQQEARRAMQPGALLGGTPEQAAADLAARQRAYDEALAPARRKLAAAAQPAEPTVELRYGGAPELVRKPRTDPGLTPAEREVLARIGPADPIRRPPRERIGGIYARVVRGTYPIEKYGQRVGQPGRPVFQRSGDVAMLAAGSAARAEEFLAGGGGFRWTPEGNIIRTGTPSMQSTLATVRDVRGGVDALEAYEVARRAIELEGRNIRTGVPMEAAQRTVAEASPEVVAAHEGLVRLRRDARDYWAAEGGLSPEAVQAMDVLNQHYVPFQRVFGREVRAQGSGRPGGVSQPIKKITGSVRQVRDAIASTEEQIARFVESGDRNRVVRVMVEEAEANPGAATGFLEREAASPHAVNRYAADLQRMAADHGVQLAPEIAAEIAATMAQGELFATGGRVTLWRNGRLEAWRANPELAKALASLGPYQAPWYVRMLGLGARMLKAGVTLDPIFSIVNAWRDTLDATIQSGVKFRPGIDSAIGFWNAVMKTPAYQELRAGGLGFSNTIRGRIRSEASAMRLVLPTTSGQWVASKTLHPFEALADFARPFEEAARVGEGLRVRKRGGSVAEAVRAGQEITTNFQQVGMSMQGWAHMTAFLNPAVQSLDRAFRVAGGDAYAAARATGVGRAVAMGRASKASARVTALGVGAVSVPSIFFWFANRGDQEIQDLRKTNAGLIYWFVRDPTGQVRHLPKPFLWGQIFGTGVETVLDRLAEKDPQAVTRFGQGLWDQVSTNLYPTTLQQIEAQRRNQTPFFGTPIVPPEQVGKIEPRYQATERTGPAARAVSEAIGRAGEAVGSETLARSVSPARLEALARGFGGRLAGYGITAADKLLATGERGPAPTMQQADVPLLGRLTARTPTTAVQPVQQFYRLLRRATEATNTLKLLDESGEADNYRRADAYEQKHRADLDNYVDLTLAARQMADIRREQEEVRRDPRLSAQEKRHQLDELTRELVELAREVVRGVRQ